MLAERRLARRDEHPDSGHGRLWQPQARPAGDTWRGPARHLLVSVAPLALLLLLVHGPRQLVWAVTALGVASAAGLVVRRHRQRRSEVRWAAGQQRAKWVLERIWEDWVDAEAERGLRELEHWRRTRNG